MTAREVSRTLRGVRQGPVDRAQSSEIAGVGAGGKRRGRGGESIADDVDQAGPDPDRHGEDQEEHMSHDTIEDKLRALAECGFKLKDQFGVSDLVESWGREELDKPGFKLALVCLGMTQEGPPWTPHCDNLWHFDTECIEDEGSYVRIAERMAEMAQGSLPLSDLEDHVDLEEGTAWLQFKCQGKPVHIDCAVEDDWVDRTVFGHFVALLAKCDPNKLFIYHDLGGQDCIIGCATLEQYGKLKRVIPEVRPLTG